MRGLPSDGSAYPPKSHTAPSESEDAVGPDRGGDEAVRSHEPGGTGDQDALKAVTACRIDVAIRKMATIIPAPSSVDV